MWKLSSFSAAAAPTILAFIGVITWFHVPGVYTLEWDTLNPQSVWRVNYETRTSLTPIAQLWSI
jgi:hypothetical protein